MIKEVSNLPPVVSREEWLEARKTLLEREKAATREKDLINAERRRLPMVRIDKPYRFDGPDGPVTLLDMFEGLPQLIVYHFMFDPDWEEGCKGCTGAADELSDGLFRHLRARDTALAHISRAPIDKIQAYKAKRGWTFPWYSAHGSDFNYDFGVTLDEKVAPIVFNYRSKEEHLRLGRTNYFITGGEESREAGAYSAFLRVGDDVFHTYSAYSRGTEIVGGSYGFLDMTPMGRSEGWEEPKGRAAAIRRSEPFFE